MRVFALLAWLGVIALPLVAHPNHDEADRAIKVVGPWARATSPNAQTAAAYMVLWNRGATADRLIAADSPAAERVEIHRSVADGNRRRMVPLADGLALPPNQAETLQPGGTHLMFLGLKAGLAPGDHVLVTLSFEKAGPVTVEVAVKAIGHFQPTGHH